MLWYSLGLLACIHHAETMSAERVAQQALLDLAGEHTSPEAMRALFRVWPALSRRTQGQILQLGTTLEVPQKVPSVAAEYAWMQIISCNGGVPQTGEQDLLMGPTGLVDMMSFACPDGKSYVLYFDFSADPTERAFLREQMGL